MITTNESHGYDIECDERWCEARLSDDYAHCLGWASRDDALKAALKAGWLQREENGAEHFYCWWHTQKFGSDNWLRTCENKYCVLRCARCGDTLEISAESRAKAIATYASCGWKLKWDFDGRLAYALCPYCGGLQEKDKRND